MTWVEISSPTCRLDIRQAASNIVAAGARRHWIKIRVSVSANITRCMRIYHVTEVCRRQVSDVVERLSKTKDTIDERCIRLGKKLVQL